MTCDDDKQHFEFGIKPRDVPIEENSYLKRERHVKNNAAGMVADVCVYTVSGFPINVHYRRNGESEIDSVKAAFKFCSTLVETDPTLNLISAGRWSLQRTEGTGGWHY
jgi:hypothetical protein